MANSPNIAEDTMRERRVGRRVSAETVAEQLVQAIKRREFRPGDRLREQDLAERFGVSRGPVREALRMLQSKSLVRIVPMRGASVASLSDREAVEAVEIGAALFALGMRKAAEAEHECALEPVKAQWRALEEMADLSVPPKAFYRQTVLMGDALLHIATTQRLRTLLLDVRLGAPAIHGPLGFTSAELRKTSIRKWAELIDAVETRQADTAERLARELHLDALEAALGVLP
ncbi:MAG: GntR family transcriptional regulator [Pseudomonadota bacterium]